jgi:hypothetical protein
LAEETEVVWLNIQDWAVELHGPHPKTRYKITAIKGIIDERRILIFFY